MNPNSSPHPQREASLIDVELLDLGPLYSQAVEHYLSLESSRRAWPCEKTARLRIRSECRWGRVQFGEGDLFLVNEMGQGVKSPLSREVFASLALYAEMSPSGDDPGFFEATPFCQVPIDREAAASFRSLGLVALEDFILRKIPEMEAAYLTWLGVLRKSRERARASARARVEVGSA